MAQHALSTLSASNGSNGSRDLYSDLSPGPFRQTHSRTIPGPHRVDERTGERGRSGRSGRSGRFACHAPVILYESLTLSQLTWTLCWLRVSRASREANWSVHRSTYAMSKRVSATWTRLSISADDSDPAARAVWPADALIIGLIESCPSRTQTASLHAAWQNLHAFDASDLHYMMLWMWLVSNACLMSCLLLSNLPHSRLLLTVRSVHDLQTALLRHLLSRRVTTPSLPSDIAPVSDFTPPHPPSSTVHSRNPRCCPSIAPTPKVIGTCTPARLCVCTCALRNSARCAPASGPCRRMPLLCH